MDADVARAQIASVGRGQPPHWVFSLSEDPDLGSNRQAVSFRGFQPHQQPVVARSGFIEEQPRGTVVVGHDDIDVAVVVDVSECGAAAHLDEFEPRTRDVGHFAKAFALALVVE